MHFIPFILTCHVINITYLFESIYLTVRQLSCFFCFTHVVNNSSHSAMTMVRKYELIALFYVGQITFRVV